MRGLKGGARSRARGVVGIVVLISTLLVRAQPVITSNPQSTTVAPGQLVTLSVNAFGAAPLEFWWERNGRYLRAREPVLRFIASKRKAGSYDAVVRDASGQVRKSAVALVQVERAEFGPEVVVQPQSTTVREHETAYFRTTLKNVGPNTFMVWHNDNWLEGSHQIPDGLGFDVHKPTLAIPDCNNTPSYNGVYWLAVTNGSLGTVSRKVTLTVQPAQQ